MEGFPGNHAGASLKRCHWTVYVPVDPMVSPVITPGPH